MGNAKRLWNRNFTILWQGQFISDFGNVAFTVALGFWVLDATRTNAMPAGNMASMGIVEACFALPAVLLGPFAGAFADRYSRKWVIVAADLSRGVLFAAMGAALMLGVFPFWSVYPIAALAGALGAFFAPAISSAIPDIVPREELSRANSMRSFSSASTQLAGNSAGGLLYSLIGGPIMILFNGISFLYAAATQLFVKIPPIAAINERKHILKEMADGLRYTFGHKGIRALILMNVSIGFFSTIIIMLLKPLFNTTPGFGPANYGYVLSVMMAGAILGMIALSFIKIKPAWRSWLFCGSQLAVGALIAPMGFIFHIAWLYPLVFLAGAFNAAIGIVLNTVLQSSVPQENRGKVFGALGTLSSALQPMGMAASGGIAQAFGVRPIFIACCFITFALSFPIVFSRHFRAFMNADPEAAPAAVPAETTEDVG